MAGTSTASSQWVSEVAGCSPDAWRLAITGAEHRSGQIVPRLPIEASEQIAGGRRDNGGGRIAAGEGRHCGEVRESHGGEKFAALGGVQLLRGTTQNPKLPKPGHPRARIAGAMSCVNSRS